MSTCDYIHPPEYFKIAQLESFLAPTFIRHNLCHTNFQLL